MPQVITLVRGTTTISVANGTNVVSLFTNSGTGIATRVIVNQVTVAPTTGGGAGSSANSTTLCLFNNGSGTAETLIGATNTETAVQRLSITPSQSIVGSSAAIGALGPGGSIAYISNYGTLAASATIRGFEAPTVNNFNFNICPTSFWIGPNDVIRARSRFFTQIGKASPAAGSVTIAYSFTLITET